MTLSPMETAIWTLSLGFYVCVAAVYGTLLVRGLLIRRRLAGAIRNADDVAMLRDYANLEIALSCVFVLFTLLWNGLIVWTYRARMIPFGTSLGVLFTFVVEVLCLGVPALLHSRSLRRTPVEATESVRLEYEHLVQQWNRFTFRIPEPAERG